MMTMKNFSGRTPPRRFGRLARLLRNLHKKIAEPQEISQLENLFERAETLIEREDFAFEDTVKEIISLSYGVMVRDIISLTKNPDDYGDKANFYRLTSIGDCQHHQRLKR